MRKVLLALAVAASSLAFTNPPSYSDVKPIFEQYCTHCHGNIAAAKGLNLEVFPFRSELRPEATLADLVSLAISRIRATNYPMPPGGGVPDATTTVIEDWLTGGLEDSAQ